MLLDLLVVGIVGMMHHQVTRTQAPQAGTLKVATDTAKKDSWVLMQATEDTHRIGLVKQLARVFVGEGEQGTWRRVVVCQCFPANVLPDPVGIVTYRVNPTTTSNITYLAAELLPQLFLRKLCHARRTADDLLVDLPRGSTNDDRVIFLYNTPHARFYH